MEERIKYEQRNQLDSLGCLTCKRTLRIKISLNTPTLALCNRKKYEKTTVIVHDQNSNMSSKVIQLGE